MDGVRRWRRSIFDNIHLTEHIIANALIYYLSVRVTIYDLHQIGSYTMSYDAISDSPNNC
jgi:hypothetical protein